MGLPLKIASGRASVLQSSTFAVKAAQNVGSQSPHARYLKPVKIKKGYSQALLMARAEALEFAVDNPKVKALARWAHTRICEALHRRAKEETKGWHYCPSVRHIQYYLGAHYTGVKLARKPGQTPIADWCLSKKEWAKVLGCSEKTVHMLRMFLGNTVISNPQPRHPASQHPNPPAPRTVQQGLGLIDLERRKAPMRVWYKQGTDPKEQDYDAIIYMEGPASSSLSAKALQQLGLAPDLVLRLRQENKQHSSAPPRAKPAKGFKDFTRSQSTASEPTSAKATASTQRLKARLNQLIAHLGTEQGPKGEIYAAVDAFLASPTQTMLELSQLSAQLSETLWYQTQKEQNQPKDWSPTLESELRDHIEYMSFARLQSLWEQRHGLLKAQFGAFTIPRAQPQSSVDPPPSANTDSPD